MIALLAALAGLTAGSVTGTVTAGGQPVTAGMALAPGATVDTSAGTLVLKAPKTPSGTQSLTLTGGLFTVNESGGLVKLVLQSKDTRVCLEDGKVKRKLTAATSSGRFEITARWAKVTVAKGRVTVSDKCQTTTVKVEKGSAKVRDLAKKRTLTLKAGKRVTIG